MHSSLLFVIAATALTHVRAEAGIFDLISSLKKSNSSLLRYPTQLTQGIVPIPVHSHNDYWEDTPLLTALSHGVTSVEADVWAVNGVLYVGHEAGALTKDRTLGALYIKPLVDILDAQNPVTEFTVGLNDTSVHGVFDTSSGTTLYFFIDIKTPGNETFQLVLDALEPLRERGYLTTFSNGILTKSAVTAIGTGDTPLALVQALMPRIIFVDAPLGKLHDTDTNWDINLSPIASGDYEALINWNGIGEISDGQLANMTRIIKEAHDLGIKVRYWDTPGSPIYARDKVWKQLVEAGADLLNADDLVAASAF